MSFLPRSLIVIAILTVLISAAYSFYYQDRPRIDALGYDRIGWNLARGFGYIEEEENILNPEKDWAINRVGPGYQFFLAGVYALFGHHIWIVWILHAFLRGLTVIILFLLATTLFPGKLRLGVVAAFLFGFSPDLIVINGLLLTETLFLFLLAASLYFIALLFFSSGGGLITLAAGFTLAAAILTRPTALLLLLAILGIFLFRKEWKRFFLIMFFPILLIGPWSSLMSSRYDMFILTTGVGGYDFWVGNSLKAEGGFEKTDEKLDARYSMSIAELDAFSKKQYFEFLTTHPFRFLELQWRKTALYFSLIRPGGYWVHLIQYPWQRLFTLTSSFLWTAVLFIGGTVGLWFFFKQRKDIFSRLFIAFAFFQPLSVIPVIVETRYRYSLYPFLSIFAASFLLDRPYPRKVLAAVLALFFLFAGYDFLSNTGDILTKLKNVLPF